MAKEQVYDVYKTLAINILIPLAFVLIASLMNYVNKLEDRIYTLQGTAVTETKLTETKKELMSYMDVRLSDINNKMEIIIRQLERVDANRGGS